MIDFPGITALRVTRVYYDGYGIQRTDTQDNVADKAVIWLFENTSKYVVGKTRHLRHLLPQGHDAGHGLHRARTTPCCTC